MGYMIVDSANSRARLEPEYDNFGRLIGHIDPATDEFHPTDEVANLMERQSRPRQ